MFNSRKLLNDIFYGTTMVNEDKFQLKPKLDTEKATPELSGPEREQVDTKLKELSGILTKLGIDGVADRLVVNGDSFHLNSNHDQHTADSNILFDFSKIQPLIDKGYVTVDRESDGENWAIIILAADGLPDLDLPSADDLEAVQFDNGDEKTAVKKESVDSMAEKFVKQISSKRPRA